MNARTAGDGGPRPTPGQTVGPFFALGLDVDGGGLLVPLGSPGAVRLHGTVSDGAGDPVPDAVVELWQADPEGRICGHAGSLRRDGYTFTGWGRVATDAGGHYDFTTLRPGPTAGRTPFFALTVFARGLLDRLFTRVHLPADAEAAAPEADSFIARMTARPDGAASLRFDLRLQGEEETVFLRHRPATGDRSDV